MDAIYVSFVDLSLDFDYELLLTNIQYLARGCDEEWIEIFACDEKGREFLKNYKLQGWDSCMIAMVDFIIQPPNAACRRCKKRNITLKQQGFKVIYCIECCRKFIEIAEQALVLTGKLKFKMIYHSFYLFVRHGVLVDDVNNDIGKLYFQLHQLSQKKVIKTRK